MWPPTNNGRCEWLAKRSRRRRREEGLARSRSKSRFSFGGEKRARVESRAFFPGDSGNGIEVASANMKSLRLGRPRPTTSMFPEGGQDFYPLVFLVRPSGLSDFHQNQDNHSSSSHSMESERAGVPRGQPTASRISDENRRIKIDGGRTE